MADKEAVFEEIADQWKVDKMEFNDDNVQWLNEQLFEKVLEQNLHKSNLQITKLERSVAVAKGENYGSIPVRVSIVYKSKEDGNEGKEISLIVKSSPIGSDHFDRVFKAEILLYDQIWPEIAKILNIYEDYDNPNYFVPRYFRGGPSNAIIMNDLGKKGYRNAARHKRLDLHHVKLVLHHLAQLHAASLKYAQRAPGLKADIVNMFEELPFKEKVYSSGTIALSREILSWPGYEHYSPILLEWSEKIWPLIQKLNNSGKHSVIIQGDCWTNNILFHYPDNSDKPDALAFVDFQLYQWARPAFELLYVFYISARLDVLQNDFETLLDYYLKVVQDTLKQLGIPPSVFTKEDLRADIDECLIYGIFTTWAVHVITQAPAGEHLELSALFNGEAIMEGSDWRTIISQDQDVKKCIQAALDQATKKGLL